MASAPNLLTERDALRARVRELEEQLTETAEILTYPQNHGLTPTDFGRRILADRLRAIHLLIDKAQA